LFYLRANGRKRKKHIQVLQTDQGSAFKHEDKAKEIDRHFGEVLGTKRARQLSLNWEVLGYPTFDLIDLEIEIIEEEVKAAIGSILKENAAPGPDGFIAAFYQKCSDGFIGAVYQKCWDIVKGDVIAAVMQLSQLRGRTFNLLNIANIVLLPKKEEAIRIEDYRPSLVHSISSIYR
jgi:hypothetical protein